jgi:hypothetical protein
MSTTPKAGVGRTVAIPQLRELREFRLALARGGGPAEDRWSRIALFEVIAQLLRFVEEYRRRLERGEECRLVVREAVRESDRLVFELAITAESGPTG